MIRPFLLIGSIGVLLATPLRAATYDWFSATSGGLWSEGANWTPAGGPPIAADSVNLTDATQDRTVFYDAAAVGTIATVNFDQTSAFTNTLEVQRALTISNPIVLGSTLGVEELKLTATGESGYTLTVPGGITLNQGGRLVLGLGTTNNATTRFGGNVTIEGGELLVTDSVPGGGAAQRYISGTLTAAGGAIAVGASQNRPNKDIEARLQISGDFSVSGTTISGSADAQLIIDGATNYIGAGTTFANPGTGANTITTVLSGSRNQTLTSEVKLGRLFFRQFGNGTFIKTVTVNEQSGPNIDQLQFAGKGGQTIGLKLGSNLRTGTGAAQPVMSGVGQSGDINFSIDTNSFTLELGNTSNSWIPVVSGGAASVAWSLLNSGTPGEGGIKVRGVEFNRSGVTVDVGAGMVLDLTGGDGVASSLGTAGTIDNTSTIRYSGPAAAATPATLTSGRAVGQLEIGNGTASGALKLAGNLTANGAVTVKNFGSLDLDTQELTANNGLSVEAGGILRGGTEATPGALMGDLNSSGILAPGTTPAAAGATIGTLSVSGQLLLNTGSTLALEIVSASSFDKAVAGSVSLNGTVNLSLSLSDGYVHSPGISFLLLENVGGGEIDGFFTWGGPEGLLAEGETFLVGDTPFQITYVGGVDDNDVVITAAVPEPSAAMALVCGAGMMLGLRRARRRD